MIVHSRASGGIGRRTTLKKMSGEDFQVRDIKAHKLYIAWVRKIVKVEDSLPSA